MVPLACASFGDEVPESLDAPAHPSFYSQTPCNTLALTVLSLRGLDSFSLWYPAYFKQGRATDPLLTAVSLECACVLRGYSGPSFEVYIPSTITFGYDLIL